MEPDVHPKHGPTIHNIDGKSYVYMYIYIGMHLQTFSVLLAALFARPLKAPISRTEGFTSSPQDGDSPRFGALVIQDSKNQGALIWTQSSRARITRTPMKTDAGTISETADVEIYVISDDTISYLSCRITSSCAGFISSC